MKIIFFSRLKEESEELGISFWKHPDVVLLAMGLINIFVMVVTYAWASNLVKDPREAVLLVAAEATLIILIGNIISESSRQIFRTSRLRKEFVQIISHQMRTPITTIKWNVELLKIGDPNLTSEQLKNVEKIEKEIEKIKMTVADVMNASKTEAGLMVREDKPTSFNSIVRDCIERVEEYARLKKVIIKFKTDLTEEDKTVLSEQFKIVFLNLIENAVRYSQVDKEVVISLGKKKNQANFSIKDWGIGIAKEDRENIFAKFYRGKNALKKEPEGTGLGLYVTKLIVENARGKISFHSKPKEGTEFKVALPID